MTIEGWPAADDEAAGAYLASRGPMLVRFATSITRDHHGAEDLAQEALLRAYARRDELEGVADIDAWLRRVVHNLAVDRSRRDREIVVEDVEGKWMSDEYTVDTAAVVAAAETREEIEDALVRLPFIYRSTVVMHDIEGMTVRAIAEVMDVDLPAAKQRLRRGRMMMVTALAEGHERRVALKGVPLRCWEARSRVSDFLDGDVDDQTATMLQRHLETCPTCPPLVAALVGVRDRIGAHRDPDSVVDPELAGRLREQLAR
jgi:RNA polymerase sigma-70 factor, ECF subfamily